MKRFHDIFQIAFVVAIVFTLVGCGTSGLIIVKSPPNGIARGNIIQVNEIKSTTPIPEPACEKIRDILIGKLEKTGAFEAVLKNGGKIIMDINIKSFDAGNQFERWFWGGLGDFGEGKIVLETVYTDAATNNEAAKIITEGTINCGVFGGSIDTAYSNAIQAIVKYTVEQFGKK